MILKPWWRSKLRQASSSLTSHAYGNGAESIGGTVFTPLGIVTVYAEPTYLVCQFVVDGVQHAWRSDSFYFSTPITSHVKLYRRIAIEAHRAIRAVAHGGRA